MSVTQLAVLALSVLGSAGGLIVASLLLFFGRDARARVVPWLVSYAVGTLLGAAFLGLLPEALATLRPPLAFGAVLTGILTFFILEKLVIWRHCHDEGDCAVHQSTATLVIIGDAVHTFTDGVVIAATALVSLPLGLTTALAVTAHEIPQQAGDVAVLLSAGYSRSRALLLNAYAASGALLGAIAMLIFGARVPSVVPYIVAFAAGNFIYVSMADLIPHLHRGSAGTGAVRQVILIAAGVLTIALL
jgi:zinc and cadmium transporter